MESLASLLYALWVRNVLKWHPNVTMVRTSTHWKYRLVLFTRFFCKHSISCARFPFSLSLAQGKNKLTKSDRERTKHVSHKNGQNHVCEHYSDNDSLSTLVSINKPYEFSLDHHIVIQERLASPRPERKLRSSWRLSITGLRPSNCLLDYIAFRYCGSWLYCLSTLEKGTCFSCWSTFLILWSCMPGWYWFALIASNGFISHEMRSFPREA